MFLHENAYEFCKNIKRICKKLCFFCENVLNFIEKAIKKQCFRMKMLIISTKILKKWVKNYEFV